MSCVNSPRPEASNTHPLPHTATNGRVVSAVKAAKHKLCKTTKSGEDQYLSLLNIRNPLSQQVAGSVAQRLVWRRTRPLLPTTMPLQERHTSLNTHDMEQLPLNQKSRPVTVPYMTYLSWRLRTLSKWNNLYLDNILGRKSWQMAQPTGATDSTWWKALDLKSFMTPQ